MTDQWTPSDLRHEARTLRRLGEKNRIDTPYGKAELAENLAGLEALGYVRRSEELAPAGAPDAEAAEGESSPEIHNNLARIHVRGGDLDEAALLTQNRSATNTEMKVRRLTLETEV